MHERQLTVGSLFAGIGGFDLGLERAGMRVIWQSEIDPYACAVLRKHWPDVPNFGDIRRIMPNELEPVDVICGGFPCQPYSSAARGRNNREGQLWQEMLRLISWLGPTWVVGENVAAIDSVALERVAFDLESIGYTVQTFDIPACAVGLQHRRHRYWILGHSNSDGQSERAIYAEASGVPSTRSDHAGELGNDDGLSNRMDRLRCLGNAIVPQIAEIIGRAIVQVNRGIQNAE